ncbi:hypothetical protein W97_01523 [Coniosporium apollinis CBS 100218]|uniref:Alpha/beta hydrolase fold-3 domain-containing protein n=1 Tax=Coniosporium apollinis (strain CBS 100218) TaxID=1168221 RepID=R7YK49_CONA1|nr:uncharacterized protein W97_01523 [Coniosporium apollinis CBS 100218]EON62302.1 hypothetical protein W97_01523 [Coniosporium apollinis CBS 100218]
MGSTNWSDLAKMDPELKEFLDKVGPLPSLADAPSIQGVRDALAQAFPPVPGISVPENMDGVKKNELSIPVRDGSSIRALLYQPEAPPKEGSPLVVLYHGGGWCLGMPEMTEVDCVNFVQQFGCVCISVDYRLAPEHPFPVPVEDSWDALKWVAAHTSDLAADPSAGFIVGGTSAGGNIAIILSHLARDESISPLITGLWPSVPVLISPDAIPDEYKDVIISHEQNAEAPAFNKKAYMFMINQYNPQPPSHPLFSPLLWPSGHKGLPPSYFQVCGMDPLRDEGLLYERILREECGIKTKLDVYPGLPHGFWGFFPHLKSSRAFVQDTMRGMAWLLGKEGEVKVVKNEEPAKVPAAAVL